MRISMFQAAIAVALVSISYAHNGKAQEMLDKKVSISVENMSMEDVLKKIESVADVRFIYYNSIFNKEARVTYNFNKNKLKEVLDNVLNAANVEYEITNNYILLKLSPNAPKDTKIENESGVAAIKVSGTVAEKNGDAVIGATIVVKGTAMGTATDAEGKFTLEVPDESAVLVISYIGFKTQEIVVGSQTTISVSLEEDMKLLEEVVATGYGSMKRTDLSSAQVSISSKEIERTVNTTLEQAIQGRAAGVQVTQNTGQPGGGISVNIRGTASLNGTTEPLYVIDGVQILPSSGGAYGVTSSTNPLAGINPSDIESMEILQGPSATAIYGSRATNGVVVITTKRGKDGKMKIEYNLTYTSQQTPAKLIDVMNLQQYATMMNAYDQITGQTPNPLFADPSILGSGTNWQTEMFRAAPMSKHQISVMGGDKKTQYYLSGEYFNQQGVGIGSDFQRYSVRLNLDNQTTNWLKLSSTLNVSRTDNKLTTTNDQIIRTALTQSPDIAVKNTDGTWGGPVIGQYGITNPVALANINTNLYSTNNFLGGLNAEIKIIRGLVFRTSLNGNASFNPTEQFYPSYQIGGIRNAVTTSSRAWSGNYYWNLNQLLQYNTKIGKHDMGAMVSHEAQSNFGQGEFATTSTFITNIIPELGGGSIVPTNPTSSKYASALESYLGRLNYVFNDKYIVQASLRVDGSSTFGPNNRWGYFPAVSAAWKISNENFLKNIRQISELKIRAEVGNTGNPFYGTAYTQSLTNFKTVWGTGYSPSNYDNPNLKWEATTTYNLGLNLSMFNNRVEFIGDVYLRKTSDLILQPSPPAYFGTSGNGAISAPVQNIGDIENKGVALTLNTVNIEKPFLWKTNINISINRNQVTALTGKNDVLTRTTGNMIERTVVGQPAWQMLGYETQGLYQSQQEVLNSAVGIQNWDGVAHQPKYGPSNVYVGDVHFKNQNGDSIIDAKDQVVIGNPYPLFTFGFTNTFAYKGFDLSVLCTGSYGNDIYNYTRFVGENPNGPSPFGNRFASAGNYANVALDTDGNAYLTNPGTTIPRLSKGDPNGNFGKATPSYIEDGSYLRVKNVTLSYTLPKSLIGKQKVISNVRLGVGVQNLFTLTAYSGYDPEVGLNVGNGSSPNSSTLGVDNYRYPLTRTYTFNLSVNF